MIYVILTLVCFAFALVFGIWEAIRLLVERHRARKVSAVLSARYAARYPESL
jgi:hypothetical protein